SRVIIICRLTGWKSAASQALFAVFAWVMLPAKSKKRGTAMQMLVEKILNDFERGVLSRRQLAATLTGLAAAAAIPALAAPSLKAITLNHVTVRVPDLQKTSKFYQEFFGMKLAQHSQTIHILGVGESFFGIEQKPGGAALDHYDFGLEGWDA